MTLLSFNEAKDKVNTLNSKPSNEDLLKLYGLFKQVTDGDNDTDRPTGFDFKGQAKWDAWDGFKGMTKEDAEKKYVATVQELLEKDQ